MTIDLRDFGRTKQNHPSGSPTRFCPEQQHRRVLAGPVLRGTLPRAVLTLGFFIPPSPSLSPAFPSHSFVINAKMYGFSTLLASLALCALTSAIQVTTPDDTTVWRSGTAGQTVSWKAVSTDATSFVIRLVNQVSDSSTPLAWIPLNPSRRASSQTPP